MPTRASNRAAAFDALGRVQPPKAGEIVGRALAAGLEGEAEAAALSGNLERLKTSGGIVATGSAQDYLRGAAQPFDVVFLDPPFALDLWSTLAQQLEGGSWLTPAALIYVESPRTGVPGLPAQWQVHREAVAGAVRYALYRRVRLSG